MENLTQGTWIINTRQQEISSVSLTDYVITFILMIFLVFMFELMILLMLEDTSIGLNIDNNSYIIALIVGLFVSIMLSVMIAPRYTSERNNKKHETVSDIIIGDEVNFNDFNQHYEIIDQNGNIYTVKEKK